MSRFLIDRLSSLEEYVPGEQPRDKQYIKLNTNESPYPPSKKAVDAINDAELSDLRLYSDPECKLLKEEIANYYGVESKNVFVSNGSDESLNFFFMAFCDDGHKVCFPDISYGFYKVFGDLYSLDYEEVPLREDFSLCVEDYISKGKNIVIANPNAPTGLAISPDDIERIVSSNPDNLVLIDEAYVDFGGQSAVKLTKKYPNLVVVQTFSKSRSLAGARLGFAIAHEDIIKDLEKIKYSTNPYNINRLTLILGRYAMADKDYFKARCNDIIKAREYTTSELTKLGFEVLESKANFVFARSNAIGGEELYKALKDRGILVRHFNKKAICEFNRITIGTMEQMKALVDCIRQILTKE